MLTLTLLVFVLYCNTLTSAIDTSKFIGLEINKDNAKITLGKAKDVKLVRTGTKKLLVQADVKVDGSLSTKKLSVNGKNIGDCCGGSGNIKALEARIAKLEALTTSAKNGQRSLKASAVAAAIGAKSITSAKLADGAVTTAKIAAKAVRAGNIYNHGYYHKDFIMKGDDDTCYPVLFVPPGDGMHTVIISRYYYEQAPSTWHSKTHKGTLYFEMEINGALWGGQTPSVDIKRHSWSYAPLMADFVGHVGHTQAIAVYLRGGGPGGAKYRIESTFAMPSSNSRFPKLHQPIYTKNFVFFDCKGCSKYNLKISPKGSPGKLPKMLAKYDIQLHTLWATRGQVKDKSVTSAKLADGAVTTAKIAAKAVRAENIYNHGYYHKDFIMKGDDDTCYPILFVPPGDGMHTVIISRYYYQKAPSTWHSKTHKGTLYFEMEINGALWGGQTPSVDIKRHSWSYAPLMADFVGHVAHTQAVAVYLRGGGPGGAQYKIESTFAMASSNSRFPKLHQPIYTKNFVFFNCKGCEKYNLKISPKGSPGKLPKMLAKYDIQLHTLWEMRGQVKDKAVTSAKLADGAVTTAKIAANAVRAGNIYNHGYHHKDFILKGDDDTCYPVLFVPPGDGMHTVIISRYYYEQAPSTWHSKTHKGTLYFEMEINGALWGGQTPTIDIKRHSWSYAPLMANYVGHVGHTQAVAVYLRGGGSGGAKYRIESTFAMASSNSRFPKLHQPIMTKNFVFFDCKGCSKYNQKISPLGSPGKLPAMLPKYDVQLHTLWATRGQVKDKSITSAKLADGAVTYGKIAPNAVRAEHIYNHGYYHKEIDMKGDDDTCYPVLFYPPADGMHTVIISRYYYQKAPSTWNSKTHKGTLYFEMEINGAMWGGQTNTVDIKRHSWSYAQVMANSVGHVGHSQAVVVYLRGGGSGGAHYRFETTFKMINSNSRFPKLHQPIMTKNFVYFDCKGCSKYNLRISPLGSPGKLPKMLPKYDIMHQKLVK